MPPQNTLQDLRNHLFGTLEALTDESKPPDIERAKAVAQVAGRIIESAKVEVQYCDVTGQMPSGQFFDPKPERPKLLKEK